MDADEEIRSLNRREAHVRGNGSQLSSDNSVIRRTRKKSRDRTRRKCPSEMDLNAKKTPNKLKLFAKADKHLERVARVQNSQPNMNGSRVSPKLKKPSTRAFKRNTKYPPVEENIKDTTKLGQTWVKENQLGKYVHGMVTLRPVAYGVSISTESQNELMRHNLCLSVAHLRFLKFNILFSLKKNIKKAGQKKAKQKKRSEIFSSDVENEPPPGPSTRNAVLPVNNGPDVPQSDSESMDTELQSLLCEAEGSKRESYWKKKDPSRKVEILAPDTPELDRRGPNISAINCIISESDSE